MPLLQTGPDRYPAHPYGRYAPVNQRTLAFFVGLVALGLPTVLLAVSLLPAPLPTTCFRDSISHYYYAQFWGGPFIGALVFIGTYMIAYKGEDAHGHEGRLASVAGVFAISVALFPVSGHGCDDAAFAARALTDFGPTGVAGGRDLIKNPPLDGQPDIAGYFQLTPYSETIHYLSATALFAVLAWFALFVFTATEPHQLEGDGTLAPAKKWRNRLYLGCGLVMVAAIAVLALNIAVTALSGSEIPGWSGSNLTFWCEAVALWAFGLSWAVKSRFWGTALEDAQPAPGPA